MALTVVLHYQFLRESMILILHPMITIKGLSPKAADMICRELLGTWRVLGTREWLLALAWGSHSRLVRERGEVPLHTSRSTST